MIITKKINLNKLQSEIKAVYPEIEYITSVDNDYTFVGINDESTLTTIINNHNPNDPTFKINGSTESPMNLNYDIFGLHKKRTIIKGELKVIDYYKNYDADTKVYSDLHVRELRGYIRNELGLVVSRVQTTHWLLDNDTTGLTGTYTKHYSESEAIQEGVTKRNNMIDIGKITLLDGLKSAFGFPSNQMYAFDLLASMKDELYYYTQGHTSPLKNAISGSTKPYMLENIKIAVITELTD